MFHERLSDKADNRRFTEATAQRVLTATAPAAAGWMRRITEKASLAVAVSARDSARRCRAEDTQRVAATIKRRAQTQFATMREA